MVALAFAWFSAAAFAVSLLFFLYAYLVLYGSAGGGNAWAAVSWNTVLFSLFAVHHSLFARSGLKRRVTDLVPPGLERAVYTLVASGLFMAVCWWWRPVPGVLYALPHPWSWCAHLLFAAGVLVTLLGARRLDALELAGVRQVIPSRGQRERPRTPLQTTGLYGFVRHPVYFGWVLLVLGVPEMTMTRLTFAVLSTLYLAIAIPFEERGLIETFGADYASYQQEVRWRMLPGVY